MTAAARAPALAALAALAACARVRVGEEMLFIPQKAQANAPSGVEELFFAGTDGTRLNAWYRGRPDAKATVLFFGGNAFCLARSEPFVEAIGRHPVSLFMMDYRGYGKSEGTSTAATFRADALAAYEALRSRFQPDPRRIVVHGHSLGGFAAALVAAERPVAALVLQNPATDARDAVEALRLRLPWYARPFVRFDVAPALLAESGIERIRAVRAPTLVAGGSRDTITSPRMARALYAASPAALKRLVIVEGADHGSVAFAPEFQAAYAEIVAAVAR